MAHENLTADDVLDLVDELPAVTDAVKKSDGEIGFVVYDAFRVSGHYDDYGRGDWGFAIALGGGAVASEVLGERLSIRGNREQVREALGAIDRYARLRLGAEYLEAHEAAYRER